jgi:acyl-CoA reductase-like NAD-dependent aldehyde dehydrogenase
MVTELEATLTKLQSDYFVAADLDSMSKRQIFSDIAREIENNRDGLRQLIVSEVKLTEQDTTKEIDRAIATFLMAKTHADALTDTLAEKGDKIIRERRLARGPLLAITPFSSPLSSPAHKISTGLLASTSVLFKPSPLAAQSGRALYDLIHKACGNRLVYFTDQEDEQTLNQVTSDDRIGIISFTGSYITGQKIIKSGGVKKYHMELTGGNSPVIFAPDFKQYDDQLAERLVEGIVAKNGQRCVSIKHIFIPAERINFVTELRSKLQLVKSTGRLGPLITADYARSSADKVKKILEFAPHVETLLELKVDGAHISPAMYAVSGFHSDWVKQILCFDLPGPIVFVHLYDGQLGYQEVLGTIKRDYINSGIQLSIYVAKQASMRSLAKDLLWGGIIFNDLPTFRHAQMSFGGFGKAGLGKEGFSETLIQYTDPQTIVYPKQFTF